MKMYRLVLASCGLVAAFVLVGCAGDLSNAEEFTGTGGSPRTGGGGAGGMAGTGGTDAAVVAAAAAEILAQSCGTTGCHDDSAQAQSGLDLLSPNVEDRVVDVNSTASGCTDRVLVVAGDPSSSYLLQKVEETPGICGLPMPVVGSLPSEDVEVLREWISGL